MKKLLLGLSSFGILAIASLPAFAQTPADQPPTAQSPTADELGAFIGSELCSRYVETGSFPNEAAFQSMAVKLINTYGEGAGLLMLEMAMKFSLPPEEMLADPYTFSMLQAALRQVVDDEPCFRLFLTNEVFGKGKDNSNDAGEVIDGTEEPSKTPTKPSKSFPKSLGL